MSFSVINGKVLPGPKAPKRPTPAEIARMAYERASRVAMQWVIEQAGEADESLRRHMEKHRETELAELREEVVNPPALRGKR